MNWYVVDKREYLDAAHDVGVACRALIGSHYPALSAVQVGALMEERARVEIEVTEVVPE
jgi:enamine deaminase RidA (YjgF/YER057c/UK114 family)